MKRVFPALLMALLLFAMLLVVGVWLLSLLFVPKDAILESLPDYEAEEFYTCGGFQDTTDYAKYTYRIYETELIQSPYFQQVTAWDIPEILAYVDDFEGWVESCSDFPAEQYDFNTDIIAEGDYYYILNRYEEPEKAFWNYNLYYFDLDTGILYYFHSNI